MPVSYSDYNQAEGGGGDYGWQFIKGRDISISSYSRIHEFVTYDGGAKTKITSQETNGGYNKHRLSAADVIKIVVYSPDGDTEYVGTHTVDSIINNNEFVIDTAWDSNVDSENNVYSFSIPLTTGLADADVFLVDVGNTGQQSKTQPMTALEMKSYFSGSIDISGTPVTNDYARWTDADTLEGRSYSELADDIGSSITTIGTVTTGTLSTGAVLADVTMTLGSDADGDIYYRTSNKLTRLAKGIAGQALIMNAGATAPEWGSAGVNIDESNPLLDSNGNELLEFTAVGSAENHIKIHNSADSSSPKIASSGDDTNIGLLIESKGTGLISFFENGKGVTIDSHGATASKVATLDFNHEDDITITFPNNTGTVALVGVNETGTDLSTAADLSASFTLQSSTGNNVDLPAATLSTWGVMSDEMFQQLKSITKNTTLSATKFSFSEASDNGTNRTTLTSDNNQAGNSTVTIPSNIDGKVVLDVDGITTLESNSSSGGLPNLTLRNYHDGDKSGSLMFKNERDNTTSDTDDILGTILFTGVEDGDGSELDYASIESTVADHTDGDESGKISFNVITGGVKRDSVFEIIGATDATDTVAYLRASRFGIPQFPGGILGTSIYKYNKSHNLTTSFDHIPLSLSESDDHAQLTFYAPPSGCIIEFSAYLWSESVSASKKVYLDWADNDDPATPTSILPADYEGPIVKVPDRGDDGYINFKYAVDVDDIRIGGSAPSEGKSCTIYLIAKCSATTSTLKWGGDASVGEQYAPMILKATVIKV